MFDPDVFTIYNEEITYSSSYDSYSLRFSPVGELIEVKGELNGESVTFDPLVYALAGLPFPCQLIWIKDIRPDQGSVFTVTYSYSPTFDSITTYMLQVLQLNRPDVNIAQGSAAYNLLGATAQSVADLYQIVRYMQRAAYLNTAEAGFLDEVGLLLGVERNPPLPATGLIELRAGAPAAAGGTIAKGFQVGTRGTGTFGEAQPITYTTINAYNYNQGDTTLLVNVAADVPGENGNVAAGSIVRVLDHTPVFTRCLNQGAMVGGIDPESDDDFRVRIKRQRQLLGKCTRQSLQFLCENVPGIRQAIVQDKNTNGEFDAGYVLITLIGDAPLTDDSSPLVPASWAYAQAKALCLLPDNSPAGTQLIFQTPLAYTIDVDLHANLNIPPGVTQTEVVSQIQKALTNYINGLPMGAPLYRQQLFANILDVIDVEVVTDMTLHVHISDEKQIYDGVSPCRLNYPSNTTNADVLSVIGQYTATQGQAPTVAHTFVRGTDYTVTQDVSSDGVYLIINWLSDIAVTPDVDSTFLIDYVVENTDDPIMCETNDQIFSAGVVSLL